MVQVLLSKQSYDIFVSKDEKQSKSAFQNKLDWDYQEFRDFSEKTRKPQNEDKLEIVWRNVAIFAVLHSILLYCLYLFFTFRIMLATVVFDYFWMMLAGFGVTAGAHRLWAHRSYKANLPLRIFLMIAQSAALQNDIHEWVRDHRAHHKFTDSNADPHNARRGFFFSHVGWLMCKKHKDVIIKGKTVDMSDVIADPVVRFQMKFYIPLIIFWTFIVPSLIPWYFWGEDGWLSFVTCVGKYTFSLNGTWLVNSAAHIYGTRPYDKNIKPTDNRFVALAAFGEGWHNYHHAFPWDYKAAELGNYRMNFTTCFLDLMAKIGWATDLKTASEEMIRKRVNRTGLKSQKSDDFKVEEEEFVWGWSDGAMDPEDRKIVTRINRRKG